MQTLHEVTNQNTKKSKFTNHPTEGNTRVKFKARNPSNKIQETNQDAENSEEVKEWIKTEYERKRPLGTSDKRQALDENEQEEKGIDSSEQGQALDASKRQQGLDAQGLNTNYRRQDRQNLDTDEQQGQALDNSEERQSLDTDDKGQNIGMNGQQQELDTNDQEGQALDQSHEREAALDGGDNQGKTNLINSNP